MRKRNCLLLFLLSTGGLTGASAQSPGSPAQWESFIHSSANLSLRDTFKIQDFEGNSRNNWSYAIMGKAAVFNADSEGLGGQTGAYSLKMPPGSGISFEEIPIAPYDSVVIKAFYGAYRVVENEILSVNFINEKNEQKTATLFSPPSGSTPASFDYGRKDPSNPKNPVALAIQGNPHYVAFTASAASPSTQNGFYGLDYAYAVGSIPAYTLFSGNGNWNDTLRWSCLPAARERNALIRGKATVSQTESCRSAAIGNGGLFIASGGRLNVKENLAFYSSEKENPVLVNAGTLQIDKKVTVTKTFPRKGTWYFISFPFDVYVSGISGCTLKDGTPNQGGDYFYVKYYDSARRASMGTDAGNWITVGSTGTASSPLFEKNKGYLIALDEASSTTQLCFSSQEGAIADSFGKSAAVAIPFYGHPDGIDSPHSGWFLCGNPFPAPLPVRSLAGVSGIGSYVYYYDGTTYQVYEAGGDAVIPPFGAFFLKVKENCTLNIVSSVSQGTPVPTQAEAGIELVLSDGKYTDKIAFSLNREETQPYKKAAYKLLSIHGEAPQIASRFSGNPALYAVTQVKPDTLLVPLSLFLKKSGEYRLSCRYFPDLSATGEVFLIDHASADTLSFLNGKPYIFYAPAGAEQERFSLLFRQSKTGLPENTEQPSEVICYVENDKLFIKGLPHPGYVCIIDREGLVRQRVMLPKGDSSAFLSVREGKYTFRLYAAAYQKCFEATVGR